MGIFGIPTGSDIRRISKIINVYLIQNAESEFSIRIEGGDILYTHEYERKDSQ